MFHSAPKVVLCENRIGFRPGANKMVVFITDAPCHIAGDGIMAGIWKPYNHSCLLDGNNKYEGLDYDYPSLSEVDYLLSKPLSHFENKNNNKLSPDEGQFQVVFGVTQTTLPLYKMFVEEKVISNAAAGNMGAAGEELKDLIVEKYQNFKGELKVTLKVEPELLGSYAVLTLDSNCSEGKPGDQEITCKKVNVDNYETFSLKIKLNPDICELAESQRRFKIEASVFGQKDSSFEVSVGKMILCGTLWSDLYEIFSSPRPRVSV